MVAPAGRDLADRAWVLIAFLWLLPHAGATAQGSVEGRVRESIHLRPLSCLPIALIDSTGQVAARTTTASGGRFVLPVSRAGTYRVRFGDPLLPVELSPTLALRSDTTVSRYFQLPISGDTLIRAISAAAFPKAGRVARSSPRPDYPLLQERYDIAGEVLLALAIDQRGRVDTSSFMVLRATHEGFLRKVVEVLPRWRYDDVPPLGDAPCAFYIQPFVFRLTGH